MVIKDHLVIYILTILYTVALKFILRQYKIVSFLKGPGVGGQCSD